MLHMPFSFSYRSAQIARRAKAIYGIASGVSVTKTKAIRNASRITETIKPIEIMIECIREN